MIEGGPYVATFLAYESLGMKNHSWNYLIEKGMLGPRTTSYYKGKLESMSKNTMHLKYEDMGWLFLKRNI